jgi:hypothetical protein
MVWLSSFVENKKAVRRISPRLQTKKAVGDILYPRPPLAIFIMDDQLGTVGRPFPDKTQKSNTHC